MHVHPVRHFRLSSHQYERGVSCDTNGAFIDTVPLLKRVTKNGKEIWASRESQDISADLSTRYGLPIDVSSKANGLAVIANALNAGEVARAQLAALFLRLPEPPPLEKAAAFKGEWLRFIRELSECDLLKARWNVRWPASSPDSQGGRFAPGGTASSEPGIGHNGGPPLETEEAAAADDAAIVAGDAAVALAPIAAVAAEALALSTVPAGSGEDEAVARLKHDEAERTERHHPWPKYLGGAEDQELVELPRSVHIEYHRGLQQFAQHWRGKSYYDSMSPEARTDLFEKLSRYTEQFDEDRGTNLLDALRRNRFPVNK